uniref:Uncharacterized protein n=1 Tax=Fagus sylvatica TaxID=28930 RepID=A0A2N9FDP6_FAGSY
MGLAASSPKRRASEWNATKAGDFCFNISLIAIEIEIEIEIGLCPGLSQIEDKPPPPVRPATTTAHKRPTPRPCHEGETHPTPKPAAKPCRARSQRSGGHPSVPISAWTSGLAPNEFELAKKGITGSGARPGGGGAVPFGG